MNKSKRKKSRDQNQHVSDREVWTQFARRHAGNPFLELEPLYSLSESFIDAESVQCKVINDLLILDRATSATPLRLEIVTDIERLEALRSDWSALLGGARVMSRC